jgi:hypothetical protein
MTDWKPGDAAVAHYKGRDVRGFIDHDGRFYTTDQSLEGVSTFTSSLLPQNLRPLVVIDPEDPKDVRLLSDLLERVSLSPGTAAIQEALRGFADPKQPTCPASIVIGGTRLDCEKSPGHLTDHRNDSIGQGVRWSA